MYSWIFVFGDLEVDSPPQASFIETPVPTTCSVNKNVLPIRRICTHTLAYVSNRRSDVVW